jgi:transcriptional regulator with XRE-family HTH domain
LPTRILSLIPRQIADAHRDISTTFGGAMAKKKDDDRDYELNVEELKRLQLKHGLSDAQLAKKAEVSTRTFQRWLSGHSTPRMENLYALASLLHVYPSSLMVGGQELEPDPAYLARIDIQITGEVPAATAKSLYAKVSEAVAKVLREADIDPMAIQTTIASVKPPPGVKTLGGDKRRTIMLITGTFVSGKEFWILVAIKAGMTDAFLEAHRKNTLDYQNFTSYGEVIISGERFENGLPPVEIIAHVAEMYQTSFSQLMRNLRGTAFPDGVDPFEQAQERIKALQERRT